MNAQSFFWFPNGCNADHAFNLSSDFLFDFDKADLKAEGKQVVAELANKLNSLNVKSATIEGYTDRMGSALYNLDLSQRRADTVKAELQHLSVKAELSAVGYGKANQVKACDGNDQAAKDCLRPNHRVVVKAQGTELNAGSSEKVAGPIGPAPLYDTNYPYSPHITGNPNPALPAQNLQ